MCIVGRNHVGWVQSLFLLCGCPDTSPKCLSSLTEPCPHAFLSDAAPGGVKNSSGEWQLEAWGRRGMSAGSGRVHSDAGRDAQPFPSRASPAGSPSGCRERELPFTLCV